VFDVLQHAVRAKEILTVLARHGFADLVSKLELPSGLWQRLLPYPGPARTPGERLRLAAEELGPTFVKLGQLLSMRPDVVPHDILLELRKLQDRVQPVPAAEMLPVLTHALGRPPAEVFLGWQDTPVATASLAQVYRAQLPTGETVAIKVRKPDLQHRLRSISAWLTGWRASCSFTYPRYATWICPGW
jgi:ubiquinone biosynthesis protein